MKITTVGFDLAKNVFQVHGIAIRDCTQLGHKGISPEGLHELARVPAAAWQNEVIFGEDVLSHRPDHRHHPPEIDMLLVMAALGQNSPF